MKNLCILIVFLCISIVAFSQEIKIDELDSKDAKRDEIQLLLGNKKSHGGFGAITMGYSEVNNSPAFITGIKGGWIINHSMVIGLAAYGFVNEPTYNENIKNDCKYIANGGYAGLYFEPILFSNKPVHIAFPVVIGAGATAYSPIGYDHRNDVYPFDDNVIDYDVFFVIRPGIEVEFNLTRFFRISLGTGYRHTSKIDLHEADEIQFGSKDVLSGFSFGVTFKVGKF